jgi:hypothetical protein
MADHPVFQDYLDLVEPLVSVDSLASVVIKERQDSQECQAQLELMVSLADLDKKVTMALQACQGFLAAKETTDHQDYLDLRAILGFLD